MTKRSRWNKAAKLSAIFAVSLVAVFGLSKASSDDMKVAASAGGPTPSHTNAPGEANCTACHADFPVNSGTGSVAITGIPANYLPNQPISVTVRTSQADAVVYGFQMTVLDARGQKIGTFTPPQQTPARVQLVDGLVDGIQRRYIEHTVDGIIPAQFG